MRNIFRQWLPLAASFELMMLEGPAVQAAIGRLPDSALNLAAWGLTMSLSLLVESPVIMLLATSIALVRDLPSYAALRRFTLSVVGACTILTALVAFTPVFDLVARRLMGQPPTIVQAARPAMQVMLLWTAAIGWRRFHQGILVSHGLTRLVSLGTALRLATTVGVAIGLAALGRLPGVQVAAITLMVAVVIEAAAASWFVRPVLRTELPQSSAMAPLAQRHIWRFHMPLAATTVLTLLAGPITGAALARLERPEQTLAAWPVVFMLLLVMRGWGLALQEIAVAAARDPRALPALARFTWVVGIATSAVTGLLAATPLAALYLDHIVGTPPSLRELALQGIGVGVLLPLLTALASWARGLLVAAERTRQVYRGMAVGLAAQAALLAGGVAADLPGMWVASGAFTLAALAEFGYLRRAVALAKIPATVETPATVAR